MGTSKSLFSRNTSKVILVTHWPWLGHMHIVVARGIWWTDHLGSEYLPIPLGWECGWHELLREISFDVSLEGQMDSAQGEPQCPKSIIHIFQISTVRLREAKLTVPVPTRLAELGFKLSCLTAKSFLFLHCCLNRFKARDITRGWSKVGRLPERGELINRRKDYHWMPGKPK